MKHALHARRSLLLLVPVLLALAAGIAYALFTNGSFEAGTFSGWTKSSFENPGLSGPSGGPFTGANIVRNSGGIDQSVILSSTPPESGIDPVLGPAATFRFPKYGANCARVNGTALIQTGSGNANVITQNFFPVSASDVDPVDGKVHVRFAYAPVLEDPPHDPFEKPYFYIELRRFNGLSTTLLFEQLVFSGEAGVPWLISPLSSGIKYTNWRIMDILPSIPINVGDLLMLEVIGAGCGPGGHFGYVYVDGFGSQIPGLSVVKTAHVAEVLAGKNLIYTFTYRNGGTTAVNNVIVQETIPQCATYVSATNPSTGGTTVFSGGVVTCNLGTLAASASGTFTVTVVASLDLVNCSVIDNGNYTIQGDGVSATLGPLVSTPIVDYCSPRTTLVINTGWDQAEGSLVPERTLDNEWEVVSDPDNTTTEPRPAFSIPPYRPGIAWAVEQPGSKWISSYPYADEETNGHYVFEYTFCLADNDDAAISMTIRADDEATVYLNNVPIGTLQPSSFLWNRQPETISYSGGPFGITWFVAGENKLRVDVENTENVAMGLNIVGTITGHVPEYRYCCSDASGLMGSVWLDSDKNGVRNSGEPKTPGWKVFLFSGVTKIATTTTDGLGNYYFLDLAPGTYAVKTSFPQGFYGTTKSAHTVSLKTGQVVGGLDFGYRKGRAPDPPTLANSPNPFNPQTTIRFSIQDRGLVSLEIYNVAGQLVRVLANEELAPGNYTRVWDGRNDAHQPVSSGMYFYRLVTSGSSQTRKMLLLK